MKFKIGNLYRVKAGLSEGSLIRIINYDISISRYEYKTVNEVDKDTLCWFYERSIFAGFLEPVNECIVIYHKENEVIALSKVDGSKAIAECNPGDDFDFIVGAKLAFQKLVGSEPAESDDSLKNEAKLMAKAFHASVEALTEQGFERSEAIKITIGMAVGK